jgi:hypothetical protein
MSGPGVIAMSVATPRKIGKFEPMRSVWHDARLSSHPYREAWRTRDLDAWGEALAPGVVMHSPIITSPFRGREAAIELFGVLFEAFPDLEIVDELASGAVTVFLWRARARGRAIEGADVVRMDERGEIHEIRVLIRPLIDIARFAAVLGPPLAARRGRVRGWLAGVTIAPLGVVLALVDAIAPLLVQRR